MNLILLSGQGIKNKAWIEEVEATLKELFEETHIHYYDHWETGGEFIDVEKEYQKLIQSAETYEPYMIFAKSAGTWIVSRAIQEGKIDPEFCVFVGTAIEYGRENNLPVEIWFKDYFTPTLFIQKEKDPAIFADHLSDFLKEERAQNYTLETIPGDNHTYEDLGIIKEKIQSFLSQQE